jgi:hypothetical protein
MAERNRRKPPAARVEAILARNAAVGVIFRRGPSRWVRMMKWDLRTDRIEGGQWIDARIHVDRSDISPSGQLVACFAASYRKAPGTWTAISRPPFFTALAVWPKGDSWGGGGLFASDNHFFLSHDTRIEYGVDQFKLMDGFATPKRFRVQGFGEHAPVPACDVEQVRMVLSGWRFTQRAVYGKGTTASELNYPFKVPEIMSRPLDDPKRPRFELHRTVDGFGPKKQGMPFRIMRAEIVDTKDGARRDLGRIGWVDADHNGDVLWSVGGKLFRLAGPSRKGMNIDAEPKLVADLNDMTFEAIEAPRSATKWP